MVSIEQWIDQMYFCSDSLKDILKEDFLKEQEKRKRKVTLQDPIKVYIEMEIMRMFNTYVGYWMESHVGSY